MVQEPALHEIVEVNHTAQQHLKKKRVFDKTIHPNPENSLAHKLKCLKREVEEQKDLIEDMTEEAVKRARIHKAAYRIIRGKTRSSQDTAAELRGAIKHWKLYRKQGHH